MHYRIIPVTAFAQNCTLFWCDSTKCAVVVDPGGDPDKLIENIDALELSIESVVLTHGHLDHVGASKALSAYYNVPIIGPHVADKFWIDALDRQCQMFGFPPTESFSPDRWLEEGETVSFGDEQLEVLHCPGHTPGHVVLFNRKAKLLQVGDVLFQGSIGRTDFPQGDHAALIASIKNKLLPLGGDVSFIPGHGPMSTLGQEGKHNPHLV